MASNFQLVCGGRARRLEWVREGVRKRWGGGGGGRGGVGWIKQLSGAVCVCLLVCFLTQSKSICHQDCHCGREKEACQVRTHLDREIDIERARERGREGRERENGETQDTRQQKGRGGGKWAGPAVM